MAMARGAVTTTVSFVVVSISITVTIAAVISLVVGHGVTFLSVVWLVEDRYVISCCADYLGDEIKNEWWESEGNGYHT